MFASDLTFKKKGWAAVTKISEKESLYPQSLAAKVMNLERGLVQSSSMVGGAKGLECSIESPISSLRLKHCFLLSLLQKSLVVQIGISLGPKVQVTLSVLHRGPYWHSQICLLWNKCSRLGSSGLRESTTEALSGQQEWHLIQGKECWGVLPLEH